MKILTMPGFSLKKTTEKIQSFFTGLQDLFFVLLNRNKEAKPSRMYRLLFTRQAPRKNGLQEQYVVEEPEYYGNYE